jgi:hypothetical protein
VNRDELTGIRVGLERKCRVATGFWEVALTENVPLDIIEARAATGNAALEIAQFQVPPISV